MALIDRWTEPIRAAIEHSYEHQIVGAFPNPFLAEFCLTQVTGVLLYWTIGLAYMLVDYTRKPAFLMRFKIQPTSQWEEPLKRENLGKFFRVILRNQLLVAMVAALMQLGKYYNNCNQNIDGNKIEVVRFPTLSQLAFQFVVFHLIREVLFYYAHLLLHQRPLYGAIHKQHHEWRSPVALEAVYCHPLEHLLANILPVAIGPILLGSHPLVGHLWMANVITWTLYAHSGYHFPLMPFSPVFHDFHHLSSAGNYGILGLLDWLHGTDRAFRASKFYQLSRCYVGWRLPHLQGGDENDNIDAQKHSSKEKMKKTN